MDISLGGSMPAADTKSVVLALQGLQEKIRRLEEDRNFHREECEKAHIAHEAYKREVEDQLDRERTEHRRREGDLQRMIAEAKQERTDMSRNMEDSRLELRKFREQLDGIMDHERSTHEERESELRHELDECQRGIKEEASRLGELKQTVANLRSEREVVLSTNKRLEATVADLITMNTKLLDGRDNRRPASGRTPSARGRSAHQDPNTSTNSMGYLAPTASSYARSTSVERGTTRGGAPQRTASRPRSASATRKSSSAGLQDVYDEVEEEYLKLLTQYKEMRKANYSTSQMEAIAQLLEEKGDQLKLMRDGQTSTARRAAQPARTPRGTNKAVQRGTLVAKVNTMFKNH